jgi:hypothetical protein
MEWVGWKEVGVAMARIPEYGEMRLRVAMMGCGSRTLSPVDGTNYVYEFVEYGNTLSLAPRSEDVMCEVITVVTFVVLSDVSLYGMPQSLYGVGDVE